MNILAWILMIVGALNWGLIGAFRFDLVSTLFGGMTSVLSRIIFCIVGLAGLWGVVMLFQRGASRESELETE